MSTLSVVFATLNDQKEAVATIKSIRDTAGDKVQIVVVDDGSATPLAAMCSNEELRHAVVVTNAHRCGVGPSRTIGVQVANGDYILICDSHCRFMPGWYEVLMEAFKQPHGVLCGQCLAFDSKHMPKDPVFECVTTYQGGTLNVCGPDKQNKAKTQVMEGVWMPPPVEDKQELPCVMGACYAMSRGWFLQIDPLRNLRSWGVDEVMLSVKTWLAGGECRYLEGMKIGHKFLLKHERQPFNVPSGDTTWNKLFAIHTLCPTHLANRLSDELRKTVHPQEWTLATSMLKRDWFLVAQEQARNRRLFVHDLSWLAQKFNLPLP